MTLCHFFQGQTCGRVSQHHSTVAFLFAAVTITRARGLCTMVGFCIFWSGPEYKLLFAAVPFVAVWQPLKSISLYLVSWTPPPKLLLWVFYSLVGKSASE